LFTRIKHESPDGDRMMPTWMLLEDEPDLQEVILAMYDVLGLEGVAFSMGREAVAWVDRVDRGDYDGELPELALLDVRMPDAITGPEVSARIRQSPVLGNIVVVLMTAYRLGPQEEMEMRSKAQADLVIYKPLPPVDELYYILNGIILGR
jgi:CheY-like chemotaxis protein